MNTSRKFMSSLKEAIATTCMSTQRVWKPIRMQDQSKPKSNTWKLSKLTKISILVSITNRFGFATVQCWSRKSWCPIFYLELLNYMKLFSPDPTQTNPQKLKKIRPNRTQPMGEPNPRPCMHGIFSLRQSSESNSRSFKHYLFQRLPISRNNSSTRLYFTFASTQLPKNAML